MRYACLVGDRNATRRPEASALPEHRVGVHVDTRLGDPEPGEVTHLDTGQTTGDPGGRYLDLSIEHDEQARHHQPDAALRPQDQPEAEPGDQPAEHDAGPARFLSGAVTVTVRTPPHRLEDPAAVEWRPGQQVEQGEKHVDETEPAEKGDVPAAGFAGTQRKPTTDTCETEHHAGGRAGHRDPTLGTS